MRRSTFLFLIICFFSIQSSLWSQNKTEVEFGISYAFNTSGDIQSILIRNQFKRKISHRFYAIFEAHILDGGGDAIGVNTFNGNKPFLFADQNASYPLPGFIPGPSNLDEGIKLLRSKTNRTTFYTFDLNTGYSLIEKNKFRLMFIAGGTFLYGNTSGIWENGSGVLSGTVYGGEFDVQYVVPGNWRYWDIGYNAQIDMDYFLGKSLIVGARIAAHSTPKTGIWYPDYGLSVGLRL